MLVVLRRMVSISQIIVNNEKCAALIDSLQVQLTKTQRKLIERSKHDLQAENTTLQEQVRLALKELTEWELKNGKKLFPIPSTETKSLCKDINVSNKQQSEQIDKNQCNLQSSITKQEEVSNKSDKQTKIVKEKTVKAKTSNCPNNPEDVSPIDIRRLDLRVGKIIEISRHPDADSLYLEKIDCGDVQLRTVVSGLVNYIPMEELKDRLVVVLCNLKPAKMRGIVSEAMVMCASTPEKVEILSPPPSAEPGDVIHCDGYEHQPDAVLNPKKKIFEACAPDLKTNNEFVACYKGAKLHIPCKGPITAQTLRNVPIK